MKICFVSHLPKSYSNTGYVVDYNLLKKNFEVRVVDFSSRSPKKNLKNIIKLIKTVMWADITFSWFATTSASLTVLLSRLFRKKSIVAVGGYDAAYVPEINYGAFINLRGKIPALICLKNADLVLAVSKFTKREILSKTKPKKAIVSYLGINTEKFKPLGEKEKNLVITVSGVSQNNLKRKGLETFVKTASLVPNARFVVIGGFTDNSIEYLRSIASENVEFVGYASEKELIKWYQKASVICQLSYYEAFGLSPAEGMACGCIPVVTKERAGLPEFVSDNGFYAAYGNKKSTATAIKKALKSPQKARKKARERIKNNFSLEKREKELIKIVNRFKK